VAFRCRVWLCHDDGPRGSRAPRTPPETPSPGKMHGRSCGKSARCSTPLPVPDASHTLLCRSSVISFISSICVILFRQHFCSPPSLLALLPSHITASPFDYSTVGWPSWPPRRTRNLLAARHRRVTLAHRQSIVLSACVALTPMSQARWCVSCFQGFAWEGYQ
jgi:hypothetical protein